MTPAKEDCKSGNPKTNSSKQENNKKGIVGRHEMLQKLKESDITKPQKGVIEYERVLWECVGYINEVFERL
jgi:hypothetical protein